MTVQWRVRPLLDNRPDDGFYYIMTVVTGNKYGAATKSKISFTLVGEDSDSEIRRLEDGHREVIQIATYTNVFLWKSFLESFVLLNGFLFEQSVEN